MSAPRAIALLALAACRPEAGMRPVARAGADQEVWVGEDAALDGSESFDPDGVLEVWRWEPLSWPSGDAFALDNAETAFPVVVARQPGTYLFSLIVTDDEGHRSAADVTALFAVEGLPEDTR